MDDVNFKVARDFIERVKTKALGAEVIASVHPGQQIIKAVSDSWLICSVHKMPGSNLERPPHLHQNARLERLRQNDVQRQTLRGCCRNKAARHCWWRRTCSRPCGRWTSSDTLGKQLNIPVFVQTRRDGRL